LAAVAVLTLTSPIAIGAASAQQGRQGEYEGRDDTSQERDNRREDARNNDSRGDARSDDHRDRREAWRDDRRDVRWSDQQHNGYYQNGRWTYGPPVLAV